MGTAAFANCNLESINLPECTSIGTTAFSGNSRLSQALLPKCASIGGATFQNCTALKSVVVSSGCSAIGASAFQNCVNLTSAVFQNVTVLGALMRGAFSGCTSLSQVSFPKVLRLGNGAFRDLPELNTAYFTSCTSMLQSVFQNCPKLVSLYMLTSTVPGMSNANAFSSTPIGGYSTVAGGLGTIYVRASLAETFKSATNWAQFSSRIQGLTSDPFTGSIF